MTRPEGAGDILGLPDGKQALTGGDRSFTQAELKGFDLEKLIGINCQLNVKHAISKSTGRTYAQVTAVLPAVKGAALKVENYEREPWATADPPEEIHDPEPPETDSPDEGDDPNVPF